MKRITNLLIVALITAISVSFWSCNQKSNTKTEETVEVKRYEIEDFFKNPEKSSFKISPDGKYISYLAPYENRMNIFVQEVGSDEVIQITKITDRDLSGYFWANNDRLLYVKDNGGDENFQLYAVNADGTNPIALTNFEKTKVQIIDDLEDLPEYVIIGLNDRDPRFYDPYRLNIVTGEMERLYENPGDIVGWMTDHDGKLRIAFKSEKENTDNIILYRETEDQEFREVHRTVFGEDLSPLFFTFDNQYIYASTNIGRDKSQIVKYDIANDKELELIYKNDEVDVYNLMYSKKRKVLTAVSYVTDKRHRYFLDKETEKLVQRLETEFPEYEVGIASMNKDEDKFFVVTYSDKSRGAYYFYDKNTDEIKPIHIVSPWIDEADMADMKPIEYQSRDGKTIHGYLTLPVGKEAKNLPIVINPHGGPWARDHWGYNPEVQFLANRGYAVLQMNFRGSTGYGKAFKEASYGQWGLTMQDDITDGVNWLIEQGIADSKRIAIYGGSYGGYATLAGVTYTPDLYACGIDYVGVSNLFTFMETIPPYWESARPQLYLMVGDPTNEEDSIRLHKTSPVFYADQIKVPMLVVQGAQDPRVNINESNQIVEALKKNNIDVEYIVKENEGHGFHNQENKFEFYGAMIDFLDKHIGAKE